MALIDGLGAIGNAIREKTGTTELIPFVNMPQAILDLSGSGSGTEELETLIDNSGVLDSTEGTATEKVEKLIDKAEAENLWYGLSEGWDQSYAYLFRGMQSEVMPRINPIKVPSIANWWGYNKVLKRIDFYINTESCKDSNRAFQGATTLEYIKGINTEKVVNTTGMFHKCAELHTIELPLDFSSVSIPTQCFDGCTALVNISFVAESIKKSISIPSAVLSDDSIQSIIDGLATVETAQTLTLHKNIVLTDEQKATINAKGWTLAQ